MKIAVTYDNEQIFQHFGHTKAFKIYETKENEIISSTVVDTDGQGHGALAGFLQSQGVELLICGGIGGGAQTALSEAKILLRGGVKGSCDEAVKAYLAGELVYNPNIKCSHHSHGEGHNCSSGKCSH